MRLFGMSSVSRFFFALCIFVFVFSFLAPSTLAESDEDGDERGVGSGVLAPVPAPVPLSLERRQREIGLRQARFFTAALALAAKFGPTLLRLVPKLVRVGSKLFRGASKLFRGGSKRLKGFVRGGSRRLSGFRARASTRLNGRGGWNRLKATREGLNNGGGGRSRSSKMFNTFRQNLENRPHAAAPVPIAAVPWLSRRPSQHIAAPSAQYYNANQGSRFYNSPYLQNQAGQPPYNYQGPPQLYSKFGAGQQGYQGYQGQRRRRAASHPLL